MRRILALACLTVCLAATTPGTSAGSDAPPTPAPFPAARLLPEVRERFIAGLGALRSGDASAGAREFGDRSWEATPLAEYALLFAGESWMRTGEAARARAAMSAVADALTDGRLAPSALLEGADV